MHVAVAAVEAASPCDEASRSYAVFGLVVFVGILLVSAAVVQDAGRAPSVDSIPLL